MLYIIVLALFTGIALAGVKNIEHLDDATDLGMALRGKANAKNAPVADPAAELIKLSKEQNGGFGKACLLAACNGDPVKNAGDVIQKDPKSTALAAGILAAEAMTRHYQSEKEANTGYKSADMYEGGKKKPSKPKKKKNAPAKAKVNPASALLKELLGSRDPQTALYAMMAAGFARDGSVAAEINAVQVKNPATAGAWVFYSGMTGAEVAESQLGGAAQESLKDRSVVFKVDGALSQPNLDYHGASLMCMGLAEYKKPAYLPAVHAALGNRDIRVQADAARACAAIGDRSSVPLLAKMVPTAPWTVLVPLCDAMGAIPMKESMPVLVQRLAKETGRMRVDLVYALSSIAGEQLGKDADEWTAWMRTKGGPFQVDKAKTAAYREENRVQDVEIPQTGYFYGLPIYSDRLCFVVDSSASMNPNRMGSMIMNLAQTCKVLKDNVMFNIVDFGGDVEIMYAGSLTGDHNAGAKRAMEMDLSVGTRSYDGMEVGWLLDEVDTVYFLSDGAPIRGQIDPWSDIRRAYSLCHRHRPVAMWCIEFKEGGLTQEMADIADENYGMYEKVEIMGNEGADFESAHKFVPGKPGK